MYDLNEFARRLVYYRYKKGLTQEELANKSGVSIQSLYRYEHGWYYPNVLLLQYMCTVLDVPSNDLVGLGEPTININLPDCFGMRLKYLRELRCMSQRRLVRLSGISISQIKGYENFRYNPNILVLKKLCDALNVSGADLLGF